MLNGLNLNNIKESLIKRNKKIFENFSYLVILEVIILVFPLITYPYLIRVLGRDIYGWVITAQVIASYGTIIIEFGFKRVSARHISINRNDKQKLSEIVSSIYILRFFLWFISFILYCGIIYCIPFYREYYLLFVLSFGITFNALLFPEYYFQGIENMKWITISTSIIKLIFLISIFILIKNESDYIYVPIINSLGYIIAGIFSIYIIFYRHKIQFIRPSLKSLIYQMKDTTPIFCSDVLVTIKDKLNYIILGAFVGMENVVIYDIGSKFMNIIAKPSTLINTVIFPKMAREGNNRLLLKTTMVTTLTTCLIILIINIWMRPITNLFIPGITNLWAIRIFTFCPIIIAISGCISIHLFIARGYNKFVLKSMIFTTISYIILLVIMYLCGFLNSVIGFVWLTLLSFIAELFNRLYLAHKILNIERNVINKN